VTTQKFNFTKEILTISNPNFTKNELQRAYNTWWFNNRKKDNGGLRLTDIGYANFTGADLKEYPVEFDKPVIFTNQLLVWLDRYLDSPFYLTDQQIIVFKEKTAFILALHAGNLMNFVKYCMKNDKNI
jgi:hypothetical protein